LNNLFKRTLTGSVYSALILAGILIHPVVFALVFASLLFFTQLEFYKLVERGDSCPRKSTGLILGILLFAICFGVVCEIIPGSTYLIFIPVLIIIFFFDVLRDSTKLIQNIAITITGFIYVAVPFSLLNFIIFPGYPEKPVFSPELITGIFFVMWAYDSGAYLCGSAIGKHKIHKKISPNKTWEGLMGGTVLAVIMGVANTYLFKTTEISDWIIIILITVIFGTLGDLFESKIKRRLMVKDSGNWLPGHGGLLDRLDSFLFIIPVIFVWLTFSGKL